MDRTVPAYVLTALLAAVMTVSAQTTTPAARSTVEQCRKLITSPAPTEADPRIPSIHIVSPADNSVVYGNQLAVTVETENFNLNTDGNHWHLWLNGQLQRMVYGDTVLIKPEPGTYEICAIMGNSNHADVGMPDGIVVTVAEAGPGTPTATLPAVPEIAAAPSDAEEPPGAMYVIAIVAAGLLAAAGGWWLGARLPKGRK